MLKTVLIVEDYEDIREIMNIYVRAYGYKAVSAADGQEAVEITKECKPDLILMDITMPVMDGITATEIIRGIDSFSKVPIVAITAHADMFYDKAMKAGITEIIKKPLNFDKLESLLAKYLS